MPEALPPARRSLPGNSGGVLEAILGQVTGAVGDVVGYTSDPPDWVANGAPDSVLGQVSQGAARAACRQWANGAVEPRARSTQRQYANMCAPYLQGLGAGIDPDSNQPPYLGGQCSGVFYDIDVIDGDTGTFVGSAVAEGGFTFREKPGDTRLQLVRINGTVNDFAISFDDNWTIGLAVNGDPGADPRECGDPPPEYEAPVVSNPPPPGSPDVTVASPAGPEGVRVTVNPDGSITVQPLDENGAPIGPPGTFNRPAGEGQRGDPQESPPAEDNTDGELSGEAPPGQVMLGVVVDVVQSFTGARTETGPIPLTYSGGWCTFGRDGGEELCWFRICHPSQLFSPQVVDAITWRVKKSPGWRLRATPIYREPLRE